METENAAVPESLKITRIWRKQPDAIGYFNTLIAVGTMHDARFAGEILENNCFWGALVNSAGSGCIFDLDPNDANRPNDLSKAACVAILFPEDCKAVNKEKFLIYIPIIDTAMEKS